MPIELIYEITCEECNEAWHGTWSITEAEKDYKRLGGIVKRTRKGKKYYCSQDCYTKVLKRK